jgi:hypothetical protein
MLNQIENQFPLLISIKYSLIIISFLLQELVITIYVKLIIIQIHICTVFSNTTTYTQ